VIEALHQCGALVGGLEIRKLDLDSRHVPILPASRSW
jgi:hypothetical protein